MELLCLPSLFNAMEFMTQAELRRRLRRAKVLRVRELMEHGFSEAEADAVATKEFAQYDVLEIDERGRVRLMGLEFPDESPFRARGRSTNQGR